MIFQVFVLYVLSDILTSYWYGDYPIYPYGYCGILQKNFYWIWYIIGTLL